MRDEVLDYIDRMTWHVINGITYAPAKLPYKHVVNRFNNKSEIINILAKLFKKKLITKFSFSNPDEGIRVTAEGHVWNSLKYLREKPYYSYHEKKQYLWFDIFDEPYLLSEMEQKIKEVEMKWNE